MAKGEIMVTRSVETSVLYCKVFDKSTRTEKVETVSVNNNLVGKTDAQIDAIAEKRLPSNLRLCYVQDVKHESGLYAMPLSRFMRYADRIGDARTLRGDGTDTETDDNGETVDVSQEDV